MRMRKDAKLERIARVPLFARCSKRELAQIGMLADEVELAAGTVVVREGRHGQEFFVLVSGTVEVTREGTVVATLGPGDWFGEISLLHNAPRNATVTATTAIDALVVSHKDFSSLLATSPEIQGKILQALAERVAPTSF
jgi:CRP/FNR family transcriptional regulator, cyclic AMP receptor protein